MSSALRRGLALWCVLLTASVSLVFLPVSWPVALLLTLLVGGALMATLWLTRRHPEPEIAASLENLPEASWKRPVVLVCGDLSRQWPAASAVLTMAEGCWIRIESHQELLRTARQLLQMRPAWGRQLAVMVTLCPQRHNDTERLTSHLLALRWQISQLRRKSRHAIPLVLHAQAGCAMSPEPLWQAAMAGEPVCVWRESAAPVSVATWMNSGGERAARQQIVLNGLMAWFEQSVTALFTHENPDAPAVAPTAVLWGLGPSVDGALPASLWREWLRRHTALSQVDGWQPAAATDPARMPLPDFILPLLPAGDGLTPRQRAGRSGLAMFTLAVAVALCGSAWNNAQLLKRLAFDIRHYHRIAMEDYGPKAEAVTRLRLNASLLDDYARNGEPQRLGLGLYRGERLRTPLLDAIRSYVPPPAPPPDVKPEAPAPKIVRLDSMSLFDSGKAELKAGSTKMLVNSLVDIKAKPGWLIVVSGHTDNTGKATLNQRLSLQRAEAVRNWMRDTGDVPESCFAVQGYGASRPVADNDTSQGRALNRRVEISLVPQADACRLPDATPPSSLEGDGVDNNEWRK